jgi:hypothetical protein
VVWEQHWEGKWKKLIEAEIEKDKLFKAEKKKLRKKKKKKKMEK